MSAGDAAALERNDGIEDLVADAPSVTAVLNFIIVGMYVYLFDFVVEAGCVAECKYVFNSAAL